MSNKDHATQDSSKRDRLMWTLAAVLGGFTTGVELAGAAADKSDIWPVVALIASAVATLCFVMSAVAAGRSGEGVEPSQRGAATPDRL